MTTFTTRPLLRGANGAVTAGHYLGAQAGLEILLDGGTAIDAAAAASFVLAVVEPHLNGLAGEVPILIYSAKRRKVLAISGQGPAPRAMTLDYFRQRGFDRIPGDGILGATVPALVDAWILALKNFGRLPFARILEPAIRVAEQGYAAYGSLARTLADMSLKFREKWPSSARLFLKRGRAPQEGEVITNPPLARVLKAMKRRGLRGAHAYFYQGEVAKAIDRHSRKHQGLLRREDLSRYRGRIETPIRARYRDTTVFKCPTWCQGLVFLQQLNILEGYDLAAMGHNSADYLHLWTECAKLAFADRETAYGDPDFSRIPVRKLLSKSYAARRRELIDRETASDLMRPGDSEPYRAETLTDEPSAEPLMSSGDTTHVDAIDRWGNMVSATPSGGWIRSNPVIERLGFPVGTRGQMFSLEPGHPNCVEPGKRPRTTLTPSLAFRKGRPWLAFGTPGGDNQDQWTLQFFLNVVDFGMSLQEAIDAPTVHSEHFPSSFYPRPAYPNRLAAEDRIPPEVLTELRRRGHDVQVDPPWCHGRVLAVASEGKGRVAAAASPRFGTAYAQVF
jgi:gamma-glutamyltranspeptidase/glutathione hydrolase